MTQKNEKSSAVFNLISRGLACFVITFCSFQLNLLSKDLYYRSRIPKLITKKVRNLVEDVIAGTTSQLSEEAPVYVEPPYKDCAVTIKISEGLSMIPQKVAAQVVKVLGYLGIVDGVMRLHYEGNQLKFLGILENKKYKEVAINYNKGWFTKEGLQLDKKYSIPPFLSLIRSKDNSKKVRISDGYGYRMHPIHKRKIFHPGIDIAGPAGSAVFAALPGRVKKISYSRSYGTYLILEHQGGLETKYAHLKTVERRIVRGKEVYQGAIVGSVGQTGSVTGPHLHFEVRRGGQHINPSSVRPFALKLQGDELKELKKLYIGYNRQLRTRYPIQLNVDEVTLNNNMVQKEAKITNTVIHEPKPKTINSSNFKPVKAKGNAGSTKIARKLLSGMTKLSAV